MKKIFLAVVLCVLITAPAIAQSITYKPGTYTASAKGRNGMVDVEVTVDAKSIKSVKVVNHKETKSLSAPAIEDLPKTIVANQSLAVDAVSGATLTSRAVLEASESALKKATTDISPLLVAKKKTQQKAKDASADVVVVGGGNAGMIASIEIAKAGYKVILVEKQGMLGGGDSMLVSTGIAGGGSKLIKDQGIKNATEEDFYKDLLRQAEEKKMPVEKDSVRTYALRSGELIDWLGEIGVEFGRFDPKTFFHITKDGSAPGLSIVPAVAKQVEYYKVDYRLNTRATDIIMEGGKAAGVQLDSPGGKYKITAKAVIITTGGFSNNPELVAKYTPEWTNRPTTGAKSLTGDGIIMAEKAGADIYNMEQVKANYLCTVIPSGDGVSLTALKDYVALVNHNGKRFVNEGHPSINYKSREMMKQPKHEAYAIFDQAGIDNLKLMSGYNDAGYFITADSLEELAGKLDVNKANFMKTMQKYTEDGKSGEDKDFGRKIAYPLGKGKFYAALVTPSMQSTYGGIHVNTKAQVLDKKGNIISGLYAAGATSGHGSFANEVGWQAIITMVYGRIAGENAVAQLKGK